MSDDPLLPLDEAARRLGVSAETVLRYARRKRWRKIKGNDGVLVAVPADLLDRPESPQEQAYPSPPAVQAPDLAAIVQATIAPIQALLERETNDRRTLQAQADQVRAVLAAAQVERAEAVGVANAEKARREEIEKRLADLQNQLEEMRQQAESRRWWWPF
jgi:hypothetical protein